MLTLVAFVIAIGLLVTVHELGHYLVAVACGIKVLRFSVGFGPRLAGWTLTKSGTEFVLCVFPLGGYVKMLDEREGDVSPEDRSQAFNLQSLGRRTAVVAAGPMANMVLAVVLCTALNWVGMQQPLAVLPRPDAGTVMSEAGFSGGERVVGVALDDAEWEPVIGFEDLHWWLMRCALAHKDMKVEFRDSAGQLHSPVRVALSNLDTGGADETILWQRIGVPGPFAAARMADISPGGAADAAGLRKGDEVVRVDDVSIVDAAQLRAHIRRSGQIGTLQAQTWAVRRNGELQDVRVTPRIERDGDSTIGRVGAYIGAPPAMGLVRYGMVKGLVRAISYVWDTSLMTLRMAGRILTGDASVKNLSGPITIADYAGKSAAMGITQYLRFLALISISLGILNLLPLPVLDGGHLMYYLWESLSGRPLSDSVMERMQRLGLAMLLVMMSVAVFNDVTRLLG